MSAWPLWRLPKPEQLGSHLPRSYWAEEETRVLESWGLTLGAGCSVGMG